MLKTTNTIYQIDSPSGLEGLHLHGQRSRLRRKKIRIVQPLKLRKHTKSEYEDFVDSLRV